jgi:hypothetical protein
MAWKETVTTTPVKMSTTATVTVKMPTAVEMSAAVK